MSYVAKLTENAVEGTLHASHGGVDRSGFWPQGHDQASGLSSVDAPEYHVDESDAEEFHRSVRAYWPGLPDGVLRPDYAGVRPKLVGKGETASDFVIEGADAHGLPGLVNLLGIESPGLTSSLAIADMVADMI